MNAETKRLEVDAAMADIERKIAGTFDPNPPSPMPRTGLHERPSIADVVRPTLLGAGVDSIEAEPQALPRRNLPTLLAELQATVDAIAAATLSLGERLARVEAFLGIEEAERHE